MIVYFINIVIIYFIKYELDGMNVYVWYDVISMFVNDVVCDRDTVSSEKKRNTRVEIIRMCIVWGF